MSFLSFQIVKIYSYSAEIVGIISYNHYFYRFKGRDTLKHRFLPVSSL